MIQQPKIAYQAIGFQESPTCRVSGSIPPSGLLALKVRRSRVQVLPGL